MTEACFLSVFLFDVLIFSVLSSPRGETLFWGAGHEE